MEQQDVRGTDGPGRAFAGSAADAPSLQTRPDWRRELRDTILNRVLPRLSATGDGPGAAGPGGALLPEAEVAAFAEMALATAVPVLVERVEALRRGGLSLEDAALRLLAPAARRLGDLWVADRLSFLDVTVALGRLQGVMRALGAEFDAAAGGPAAPRTILLAPVAGEQHTFGLSLVAAFFRRAGWSVTLEPRIGPDELLARARTERFTAIGLSVASDRHLPALAAQVEALRRATPGGSTKLLAGGPAFLLDPGLRGRVDVDLVASDAAEAVRGTEALLRARGPVRAAR